jgi:hypothetical protein
MKRMLRPVYKMQAKVWLYPGPAGWHFVTLPRKQSDEIRSSFRSARGGWGSMPVIASIGETSWNTSIFPDKKSGAYVLPLKASVRAKEKIEIGQVVAFTIEIRT